MTEPAFDFMTAVDRLLGERLAALPAADRRDFAAAVVLGLLAAACGMSRTLGVSDAEFLSAVRQAIDHVPRVASA